jgi:hypothetical protein
MSVTALQETYENVENAFKELLPPQSNADEWQNLLPLDVIVVANDDADFEDFKRKWERFLEGLDQLWNRLNAFAKHHIDDHETQSSVSGYLGNVNGQRIDDELLVYLNKARNSAHHTLWRHVRSAQEKEVVTDAKGVAIDVRTNEITIRSNSGGTVSEIAVLNEGAVLLKEVQVVEKGQKKTYFLPETHQGMTLYPMDRVLPQMIGKRGLLFYKEVLSSVVERTMG